MPTAPTPEAPKLYSVRNSRIAGKGVFAEVDIPRGTRILEYTGRKIREDEVDETGRIERVVLFDLGNGYLIEGDPTGDAPYVNHSCAPNCYTQIIRGHIWIIAKKKIRVGEELTYDYMFGADEELYECKCGAATCRGTINLRE